MDQSYSAVKSRIQDAINVLNTRTNAKVKAIAREFEVPYNRLRNRLAETPSKSEIRGLYNRLLTPNQDLALVLFYERLSNINTLARLNSIKSKINRLLRQTYNSIKPLSIIRL